ncbi:SDR family NAD(P)-dependent oxidoreductase [Streptococcus massiliensis]|uniref:Short-chain alcohol dehydrogenase n=1 Tax=Streptococcus massiliensis TaxID=313439 RepID=A0A380KVH2_9STRE|nr:SDR family NAD(P)-dependent oxidoreductase [Streptococcus massiliensis]SUN75912.1 short-chain alcohol dehydrogenase [Streptococcus massiliensis]
MARTVLITGATSGIGRATANAFAKNGDNLIILGRRKNLLSEAKAELENSYKIQVATYVLDVTQRKQSELVIATILEEQPMIDILVNNAGLALDLEKFQNYSLADVDQMIDTNIKGLLYVSRLILPHMVAHNQGHIINIGSTAGIAAYAGAAVYCATKAAVKVLSDGMRIDTIDTNIKITTIQPGIVETDFSTVRFHGDKERAAQVYKGVEALKSQDIADVILYVANQPQHVQISDVTIMATQQATGSMIFRTND